MRSMSTLGRWAATAALVPAIGGCWVVLGESFTGYGSAGPADGGDAGDTGTSADARDGAAPADGGGDGAAVDAGPHMIDDCLPSFMVANGIQYPDHAPPALDITGTLQVDTDTYPGCIDVLGGGKTPYCLLLLYELHIGTDAKLQTAGSRPIVVMTVQNLTTENNSLIDVAGGDTGSFPGAGDHSKGAATGAGGGGGNAEPGGGSTCGATGGSTIVDTGLFPGGNGGGPLDTRQGCRVGGSGGGALELVSLCGTITLRGTIDASGGAGGGGAMGDQTCPDGYGGGAGGTIWMQSDKKILFDTSTAGINLSGGGGGGGACRPTAADPWASGNPGSRGDAGAGATCAGSSGGDGGLGGVGGQTGSAHAPGNGTQGTGDSKCGGGGGGRGRLVLVAPETTCADVVSTGVCSP
jgi:hypothetical protein